MKSGLVDCVVGQEDNIICSVMEVTNDTPGSKSTACNESKQMNVGDPPCSRCDASIRRQGLKTKEPEIDHRKSEKS